MDPRLTRRGLMAASAAAGAYVLLGCGDDDTPPPPKPSGTTSASTSTSADCTLTPEQTEGPYYVDNNLIRADITDGKQGAPLDLRLTVLDAGSCEPIQNATVEIWHCDAEGAYSGVQGESGDFLRGGQRSGRDGQVTFKTIYPGWYQGRATHIHVKVHVSGQEVHTGQLYFDDSVNRSVYSRAPYDSRGAPDTTNANDGIYQQGGAESTVAVRRSGDGYTGRLSLGVQQA